MRAIVVGAVVTSVLATGCMALKSRSGNWGGGYSAHTTAMTEGRVDYGIAHLTVNDRVYFVLVSEGGSGSCYAGPPASGTLRAADSRKIDWTCDTSDGRTGRVTIGGERFDLDKGAVFLVNLRDGNTTVEQVALAGELLRAQEAPRLKGEQAVLAGDLLQGWSIEDQLKTAAASDERLAAFLKLCETPKKR